MDKIINSCIKELFKQEEIEHTNDSKDFEKFSNFSIISAEHNQPFDLDFVTIGDGDDTGIDGIAIIVNGCMIENTKEVDDFIETNGFLEVTYIFIQSKTSPKFNGGDIRTFISGVEDFFRESPRLRRNKSIEEFCAISNHIYTHASKFRSNPICKLFYVTTGTINNDQTLQGIMDEGKEKLQQTNFFSSIDIQRLGANEITKYYRKTKENIEKTIVFNNQVPIPEIKGITEAYIGILPFLEFIKIIASEEGNLLNVFEDNVRDFQGDSNDVNDGIAGTISNGSEIFSVLNNGVTIVANKIARTGNKFTITDYQIVNGCQTSNVLFNNRHQPDINKINIPIKLIATEDDEIKTRITLATNNQTPIKKEELASLTKFQRALEQFYNAYSGEQKLYYERRSKQYASTPNIPKSKIITIPYQIKSFASMFLNEPHNVTSFFGMIVKKLNENKIQIFNENHKYIVYYTSAYAYYKLESLFKSNHIDPSYKKVKFHLLYIFRCFFGSRTVPKLDSKEIETYCQKLLNILDDDLQALEAFKKCCSIIDNSDFDKSDKQNLKLVAKTKALEDYIKSLEVQKA